MSRPVYILVALLLCSFAIDAAERKSPIVHMVKRGDTLSGIAVRYRVSQRQIKRWNKLRSSRIHAGQSLKVGPPARSGDWYRVRRGDTLSKIARQFAVSVYKLKAINHLAGDVIHVGQKLRLQSTTPARSALADDHDEDLHEYTVRRGDTLSKIARRFDVALSFLRQLNQLKSNRILIGQKLRLRASRLEEAVHVVQEGETLTEIARRYPVSISQLQHLNALVGDRILIGQKLRLKDAESTVHIVERGDALWEIARAYGISVYRLKMLNGLSSNLIYPGQELKLYPDQKLEPNAAPTSGPRLATYVVQRGDYLGQIARLHQMSVAELTRINKLKRNAVIHPGTQLIVRPMLRRVELSEINWDDLQIHRADMPKIAFGNGPYYFSRPDRARQPDKTYYEGHPKSPRQTYDEQAMPLWREFESKVGRMGRLSSRLEGWHIVLDPGHGGLDPGAVVSTRDGNGRRLYIVEDEYVFDIALRVYVLVRLHGAHATMTLLSPNHLIRQNEPPTQTFVNEKNEVYNSAAHNKTNKLSAWPRGSNLSTRVLIARQAFKNKNAPRGRRIFLSFHADIDPKAPEAPLVLYYKSSRSGSVDHVSRQFASSLLPALGAGARIRGQGLGVLRNNLADFKVLIELRNMAYRDHVWALRFEDLRHRDAEKVVQGLLDHAASTTLRAGY